MAGAAESSRGAPAGTRALPVLPGPSLARSRALRWRPPRIALALAAGAGVLHVALWGWQAPWGSAPVSGALLAGIGLGWMLWAWALFRAARTPIRPADAPLVLVDEGPYRFGRNPMYLGIAASLAGAGLALGVPLLPVAAAVFLAIVRAVHVPHEEAQMVAHFGGWYRDYAASVRRWI